MRIGAVGIHCHHGRVVAYQVLASKRFQIPLLNFVFVGAALAHAPANLPKGGGDDGVNRVAGGKVRLDLFFGQSRFKLRYQVAGADYVLPQSADQINRAGIDQ